MKRIVLISIFTMTLGLSAFKNTAPDSIGTLTIHAHNFTHRNGKAVVNLFRENDDLPKKPFRSAKAEIINGKAEVEFRNIPHGEYAAILFHDENSNGTLDHKLGFPNEPMGFSNSWRLTLFSGMPRFTKLKFDFSIQQTECTINLQF